MHTISSSAVLSRDGTAIAFDRIGHGPPVILVVGAFNARAAGRPLAEFLAPRFNVFTYDRRGRGESGDTLPYAVEREIDDLAALIDAAGGSAAVFGYSSGAMLALQAAGSGLPITRLACYDAPYIANPDNRPPLATHHADCLAELITAGRRGDAVEYFQRRVVGIPEEVVIGFRTAPFRPALEAMAHTLVYEATILGDQSLPIELAASITIPTLMLAGGASPFMCAAAEAIAQHLPNGQARILAEQTHDIVPSVLGPVLAEFLAG